MKILLGTGNAHKIIEMTRIIKEYEAQTGEIFEILSLKDFKKFPEPVEDGTTFEENAYLKAKYYYELTKIPTITDDSGIYVDYLKGPGIYSARFAGENATDEENRQKLMKSLKNIPMSQRSARFVSAVAVVFPDGKEFVVRGTCEGQIGFEEKGKNGFGYDSLFIVNGYNKTFAEIPSTIQNAISHRANSLKLMKAEFRKRVGK